MPEGDTIFRTARTLTAVLSGQVVTRAASALHAVDRAGLAGHRVVGVEARGKNLLIHFDDARTLYTHMRMTGSWHVYRPGEAWQKPRALARVVLETERFVAVAFSAPVVEILTARELTRHPVLGRLGPDILAPHFDVDEACRRIRLHPARPPASNHPTEEGVAVSREILRLATSAGPDVASRSWD